MLAAVTLLPAACLAILWARGELLRRVRTPSATRRRAPRFVLVAVGRDRDEAAVDLGHRRVGDLSCPDPADAEARDLRRAPSARRISTHRLNDTGARRGAIFSPARRPRAAPAGLDRPDRRSRSRRRPALRRCRSEPGPRAADVELGRFSGSAAYRPRRRTVALGFPQLRGGADADRQNVAPDSLGACTPRLRAAARGSGSSADWSHGVDRASYHAAGASNHPQTMAYLRELPRQGRSSVVWRAAAGHHPHVGRRQRRDGRSFERRDARASLPRVIEPAVVDRDHDSVLERALSLGC